VSAPTTKTGLRRQPSANTAAAALPISTARSQESSVFAIPRTPSVPKSLPKRINPFSFLGAHQRDTIILSQQSLLYFTFGDSQKFFVQVLCYFEFFLFSALFYTKKFLKTAIRKPCRFKQT
jgi:hypothetical protein